MVRHGFVRPHCASHIRQQQRVAFWGDEVLALDTSRWTSSTACLHSNVITTLAAACAPHAAVGAETGLRDTCAAPLRPASCGAARLESLGMVQYMHGRERPIAAGTECAGKMCPQVVGLRWRTGMTMNHAVSSTRSATSCAASVWAVWWAAEAIGPLDYCKAARWLTSLDIGTKLIQYRHAWRRS